jgi:hypothetical protein
MARHAASNKLALPVVWTPAISLASVAVIVITLLFNDQKLPQPRSPLFDLALRQPDIATPHWHLRDSDEECDSSSNSGRCRIWQRQRNARRGKFPGN